MNNKKNLSVSVVIPCLNAEATIKAAIKSARQQQGIDLQIICVDDGSDDETPKILAQLAGEQVIEYIDSGSCGDAAWARNQGLALSHGEFIQFLDADDQLLEDKLYRQARVLQQSGADLVAGTYHYININGRHTTHSPGNDIWHGLLTSNLGRTSANLFRHTALTAIDGWTIKQQSSQEYDLMFRLLKNGAEVAIDSTVGTEIIATHGSISHSNEADNGHRFIALRRQMIAYLEQSNQLTESHQALYKSMYEETMARIKRFQKER